MTPNEAEHRTATRPTARRTPRWRARTRPVGRRAAGFTVGALLLASCGIGGDASSGFDDLSEAEKSRVAEEYRDCMADGGLEAQVDYSSGLDISVTGGDISEEQMLAVEAACEPILSALDQGQELDPEDEARLADALLEAQKCLADAGYVVSLSDNGINLDSDDQAEGFDEAAYAEQEDECFRQADPELYEKYSPGGG